MTVFWMGLAGCLVVAAELVRRRVQRWMDARHRAWILLVVADDREVGELEAMLRRAAREHQGGGRG